MSCFGSRSNKPYRIIHISTPVNFVHLKSIVVEENENGEKRFIEKTCIRDEMRFNLFHNSDQKEIKSIYQMTDLRPNSFISKKKSENINSIANNIPPAPPLPPSTKLFSPKPTSLFISSKSDTSSTDTTITSLETPTETTTNEEKQPIHTKLNTNMHEELMNTLKKRAGAFQNFDDSSSDTSKTDRSSSSSSIF